MLGFKKWLAVLGTAALLLTSSQALAAAKLAEDAAAKIPNLLHVLEETEEAAKKGESQEALKEIKEFYELYEGIETQVKAVAAHEHEEIEEHVDEVKKLLSSSNVDAEAVEKHIDAIASELKKLAGTEGEKGQSADPATVQKQLKEIFEKAEEAAKAGDWNKVKEEINEFYLSYEVIEKQVEASRSSAGGCRLLPGRLDLRGRFYS